MFNLIKEKFKNSVIKNERGSTLTMTIIVIAVLSFTVTSITSSTINLSSATTVEIEQTFNESEAKGLITQSISELEAFMLDGGTYDGFNLTEISRIYNTYSVDVDDVTDQFPDFGDVNGAVTKVYRFAYLLDSGQELVKYAYLSVAGSNLDTPHPFEYSLGTNGDLILNGGYYDEVSMFGNNIYLSDHGPFYEDDYLAGHYLSSLLSGTYPDLEDGNKKSNLYFTNSYKYCNFNCFTVTENGSAPYEFNSENYNDVVGSNFAEPGNIEPDSISDFFSGFNYEDHWMEQVTDFLPNGNRTINQSMDWSNKESVIRSNSGVITYTGNGKKKKVNYPNKAYYDITNDSNFDFSDDQRSIKHSILYDGDLTITADTKFQDFDEEALIVLGNLTIDNQDNQDLDIKGTFVVTGNLEFTGNDIEFEKCTFLVLGKTTFNFDLGEGFQNRRDHFDLTFITYDTIYFDSVYEAYQNNNVPEVMGFFYTEESIWINAINSKIELEGSLYAKAKGDSAYPIFLEEDGAQINGIVINSYRGYLYPYFGFPLFSSSSSDNNNRFYLSEARENRYFHDDLTFPEWDNVTVSGELILETSEWKYE
jgi:hypothetical protein